MFEGITWYSVVDTLLFIGIIVLVTFLLLKIVKMAMKKREQRIGPKIHIKFFSNMARLFIILLAVSAIGSRFKGVSTTINTILASSGILALGISLAAQESLTNIIDGLFISIYHPFNIGDRVTLPEKNGLTGTVKEINLRHTVIQTFSNTSYIIPNSVMSSSIIDNSNFGNRTFAYPIDVTISYDSDLDLALKLLAQAITSNEMFADPRTEEQKEEGAPAVTPLAREFQDSGIGLRCWMYTDNVSKSFEACSNVRREVKRLFDENGIVIPFNTVTVINSSKE